MRHLVAICCLFLLPMGTDAATLDLGTSVADGRIDTVALTQWRYTSENDERFSDPAHVDDAWDTVDARLFAPVADKIAWSGSGWFRLRLLIPDTLRGRPVAVAMYHAGASEIYLDGDLFARLGVVADSSEEETGHWQSAPVVFNLPDAPSAVLAVRYSNHSADYLRHLGLPVGFSAALYDANRKFVDRAEKIRRDTAYQWFFGGIPMAFALIHGLIYLFYPRTRENLHFAVLTTSIALFMLSNFQGRFLTDLPLQAAVMVHGRSSPAIALTLIVWRISVMVTVLSALRFLYTLFRVPAPGQYRWLVWLGGVFLAWSLGDPLGSWHAFNVVVLIVLAEIVRTVVEAVRSGREGARVIAVGSTGLMFGAVYLVLRNLDVIPDWRLTDIFYFGVLGLLVAMSYLLSKRFATTSTQLEDELRRTQELLDANRELRQSGALDQTRAAAAGMRESQEIVTVIAALWEGLCACGIDLEALHVAVAEPRKRHLQIYAAALNDGPMYGSLDDPGDHLVHRNFVPGVALWRRSLPISAVRSLNPREGLHVADEAFYSYVNTVWGIDDASTLLGRRPIIEVSFEHGYLGLIANEGATLDENDHETTQEFAKSIALGYARFFDLQIVESQNRSLKRDRAVERIRARVQSMESAADFESVLEVLAEDIRGAGMDFKTCGISVLDDPVDSPSITVFEETGFRYSTYAIAGDGQVDESNFDLSAPFPESVRETITRFVEGESWQALIDGQTAVLEVPISSYGRLRISAEGRAGFSEDDVNTLRTFGGAIALGYARFLDLKALDEARQRLIQEMEQELQDAREMQLGLMPTGHPSIPGYEISARCTPANHVCGDFYHYFEPDPNRLVLTVADVTGHAMKAAIPGLMFSGILNTLIDRGTNVEDLVAQLNTSLWETMPQRTLISFLIGEIDLKRRRMTISDCGCPYPYHYRAASSDLVEIPLSSYPLGVSSSLSPAIAEIRLSEGDYVVLCSDGIPEASGADGEPFGYDRTEAVVREACAEGLGADGVIDRVVSAAADARDGAPQEDDMTCVALRVLARP